MSHNEEPRTKNREPLWSDWFSVLGSWFWPALTAGLLAALLLALAYARAWPLSVDIGARDNRFIVGFNATEDFGGRLVRWTSGDATIALPRPPDGRPALLSITLLNSRP